MEQIKNNFDRIGHLVKEITLTTHLNIIQVSITSVKDRFERAFHQMLTIVQGCVKMNSANVREYKLNDLTNIHYDLWLTQSALTNGYETSV